MYNRGSLFLYNNRIIIKRFFVFTFSEQLRNEFILFFKEECDVVIDHETADMYLDSLSTFYECMESMANKD